MVPSWLGLLVLVDSLAWASSLFRSKTEDTIALVPPRRHIDDLGHPVVGWLPAHQKAARQPSATPLVSSFLGQFVEEGSRVSSRDRPARTLQGYEVLSTFKLYVYDLPSAFNEDLLRCYWDENRVSAVLDEGKERGQNTAEVWLHKLLKEYPYRTYDPSEASAFYIPFYGFLSSHFSKINGHIGCNGIGHWERVHDLAAFLTQSPYFDLRPDVHAMAASFWNVAYSGYPYWNAEAFGVVTGPLYNLFHKVNLFVYEPEFGSFRSEKEHQNWPGPLITIPYNPQHELAQADVRLPAQRKFRLYFRGNMEMDSATKTGASEGQILRHNIFEAFKKVPGAFMVDSSLNFSANAYVEEMQSSTFCLVPRGDTPTSRRLFDAVVAGCIPIIVSDGISLPFSDLLDWTGFSIAVPEAEIDPEGRAVTERLDGITDQDIEVMQHKLLGVRDDFIYATGSPQDPLPGRASWNALVTLRARLLERGAVS